jgi:hypothetical protein
VDLRLHRERLSQGSMGRHGVVTSRSALTYGA